MQYSICAYHFHTRLFMKSSRNKDEIMAFFKDARKKFDLCEKFYLGLSLNAKRYLRDQSEQYKGIILAIQEMILPVVQRNCPTCPHFCCRLHAPQLQIPECDCVGWFGHIDYLLVRCDTILPDPCYENAEKNICPFWSDGCTLPIDCRSFRCIKFICDRLERELDMQLFYKYEERMESVLAGFSIRQCMD